MRPRTFPHRVDGYYCFSFATRSSKHIMWTANTRFYPRARRSAELGGGGRKQVGFKVSDELSEDRWVELDFRWEPATSRIPNKRCGACRIRFRPEMEGIATELGFSVPATSGILYGEGGTCHYQSPPRVGGIGDVRILSWGYSK